ncbi:MAG: hypothetical protein KAT37_03025 [Candidatus Aenigmarchaeota archaeon]|nr:hypothetical protein [Candidatus Aenigmarchaeota archaeon]
MKPPYKFFLTLIVLAFVLSLSYVVLDSDSITGFVTKTGQLSIGNSAPTADYIYLNDSECNDTYPSVTINPTTNSTSNVVVKATITDLNGDCNTFTSNNVTAYLCNGTGACNVAVADHTVGLSFDSQWGTGNRYCNFTDSSGENLQFFEINGSWKINVTVTDGVANGDLAKNWTYNELRAFTYPESGDTIDMGTLNLDQWNNGTAGDLMLNSGNIVIDLLWNATNFTGVTYSDDIDIDGTNYVIDDDASGTDDTGNLTQVYINETPTEQIYFDPASGFVRCADVACNNDNATMNMYWHINIPSGLTPDTYQNSIEITTEDH